MQENNAPGALSEKVSQATELSLFSSNPVSFYAGHRETETGKRFVTTAQIRAARKADLSAFLMKWHPEMIRSCGNSLYLSSRDSLYIKKGFPGYTDFATKDHGNPIDFLMKYLGYRFQDAVTALTGIPVCLSEEQPSQADFPSRTPIRLPEAAPRPYRRLFAYLNGRGIPGWLIQNLVDAGLLYQEKLHHNAVFVNPQRDYCELRGTISFARPFHGCIKASADRFWYYLGQEAKPETAFICESAIDAISLFLIHKALGYKPPSVYVSIGGVSNQKTIDRLKHRIHSVLAVDHDQAGELCRKRNPELEALIPSNKDWNEDLQSL